MLWVDAASPFLLFGLCNRFEHHFSLREVLRLLDYPAYFDLLVLPLPEGRDGIVATLAADEMITPGKGGRWNISNLGAVLFAKRLADFHPLRRKRCGLSSTRGPAGSRPSASRRGARGTPPVLKG